MSKPTRRYGSTHLLDESAIGHEARAERDDHLALKLWLRLLACSTQFEIAIRNRMRARFGISLARFDYLAQLERHADGLRMSQLSRYLMVTGGNVTALTDELEREGLVLREADADDRRSYRLRMTAAGRKAFERIAREHEQWVIELLAGLDAPHKQQLYELLGRLRVQLAEHQEAPA
ncbi:MAG: MarR family transcriptional regulator [Burkholderiaceae bacterium]